MRLAHAIYPCGLQPSLCYLGFQRVGVGSGVVGPQVFLVESHDVEWLHATAAFGCVTSDGLIFGVDPVGPVLDDDAGLATYERLVAGVERCGGVFDGDPVTDRECLFHGVFFSNRSRISSILSDNRTGTAAMPRYLRTLVKVSVGFSRDRM